MVHDIGAVSAAGNTHSTRYGKAFCKFSSGKKEPGINVLLYQMDSFYIEVYYDTKASDVKTVKCFGNTKELEPYLKQVNIGEGYALLR